MSGKRLVFLLVALLALGLTAFGTMDVRAGRGQQPGGATPTAAPGAECDGTIYARPIGLDGIEKLAWASQQVVVGTVIQQLPAVWEYPSSPQADPTTRRIVSEYVVQVEQRFRGLPGDTIRVRRPGGTLDGCTQTNDLEPALAVGQRLILFLSFSRQTATVLSYNVTGAFQGTWNVKADGTVALDPRLDRLSRYQGLSLAQVEGLVWTALTGPPPPGLGNFLVPLDQAPLPSPTPQP